MDRSTKKAGAGDEIRTRDIQLGRLELYQLSYTRTSIMTVGSSAPESDRRQLDPEGTRRLMQEVL